MRLALVLVAAGLAASPWVPFAHAQGKSAPKKSPRRIGCPADMVLVKGYCIDRYEAYVVELLPNGKTRAHSPYQPVDKLRVKALNGRGKVPQAYISRNEAEHACANAGKRLCTDDEWVTACRGASDMPWPYGEKRVPGRCNDQGRSGFNLFFAKDGQAPPQEEYNFDHLNDDRLNQVKGSLARSGAHSRCKSTFGAFDMVGNLHEWTAERKGTFRGGYYLDVEQLGPGCEYKTSKHSETYHDYSTGFRCCKAAGDYSKMAETPTATPSRVDALRRSPLKRPASDGGQAPPPPR